MENNKVVKADRVITYYWDCPSCSRKWAASSVTIGDNDIFNSVDNGEIVELHCKCGNTFKVSK